MAQARGWKLACDERGHCLREARQRLGENRLTNTPGLMLLAIRRGKISVSEPDERKHALERRRFKMTFDSFSELVGR